MRYHYATPARPPFYPIDTALPLAQNAADHVPLEAAEGGQQMRVNTVRQMPASATV